MGPRFMSDLTLVSIKLKRDDEQSGTDMERERTIRRTGARGRLLKDTRGQSLVELAVMMPIFALLMCYAVDYGYMFLAAANIASAFASGNLCPLHRTQRRAI